jgi:hypothetical protein
VPDLTSLRSLGDRVQPPPLGALQDVARRRSRLSATLAAVGAVAVAVVATVVFLLVPREDRAVPEPVHPPAPSPTRTATDESGGPATHASDTSMTLREVVAQPNADLVLSGISLDDPDFRVAIWSAPCSWCPNDDEPRGRPRFWAMVITTDGFESTTYRRIPYDPYRDPGFTEVVSPGPGLLLLVDAGNPNSPGWLLRDDGTLTHLTAAVETRSGDARRWHWCGGYDADPAAPTSPVGWCLVDAETDTSYQAEAPWLVDELVHGRPAVSPAEADEPWGLENVTDLVPYWYDGGVLHTRDFGPADATGTVSGMPRGEMAVWSMDPASLVLTVRSSAERGQSWQVRRIALPSAPSRLSVHRTRSGALMALDSGGELALYAWPPRQIWRADADADSFDVVDVESERTDVAGYDATAFTELGGRIWSGGLWSDDDGRTWHAVRDWR